MAQKSKPSTSIELPARLHIPAAAHFCFQAAFEKEHGLGILTDGNSVLGIGYMIEVEPFQSR